MARLAENRKATFDYEIIEKFSSGLKLVGTEVKSAREGRVSLLGAYVSMRGGEAYLLGADIPPYQPKNAAKDYDPKRARKLLLSKQELKKIAEAEGIKGLTIVPLSVYNKGRFLKIDVAIARGKKKYDKREAIKKRDVERDLKRTL